MTKLRHRPTAGGSDRDGVSQSAIWPSALHFQAYTVELEDWRSHEDALDGRCMLRARAW
jgi:hypothetical protein